MAVGIMWGSARGPPWFGDVIAQSARKLASLPFQNGKSSTRVGTHGACRATDWRASLPGHIFFRRRRERSTRACSHSCSGYLQIYHDHIPLHTQVIADCF